MSNLPDTERIHPSADPTGVPPEELPVELDPDEVRSDVPHGARIWNYWLGGRDNFAADRAVGSAVEQAYPAIADMAVESRRFLVRTVRHLAGEAGIDQFLDLGAGLPTMQNTHSVAQSLRPHARVVYVDHDPLVLTHARTLLAGTSPTATTAYVDADYRDTDLIVAGARADLDLDRPVALLCMGVFGYVPDHQEAAGVIRRLIAHLAPGSYLALWDATDTSDVIRAGERAQADLGAPYQLRSVPEVTSWFDGLDLLEPGVVPVTDWRPDDDVPLRTTPVDAYGGVALRR